MARPCGQRLHCAAGRLAAARDRGADGHANAPGRRRSAVPRFRVVVVRLVLGDGRRGRVAYISENARDYGIDIEAHLGKRGQEIAAPLPGAADDPMRDAAYARKPFRNVVRELVRRDGVKILISFSGMPVIDADGTFGGYRGAARDVTDEAAQRARIEAQARQLAELSAFGWACSTA